MPEGHTVHRIARDHHKWFTNQPLLVLSPQGRFADEAERLNRKSIECVQAHGKHLFYDWGRNRIMHIHLGLYGKFRHFRNPAPEPRGAVRIRIIGTERTFDLNGPNQCELLTKHESDTIRQRLGEDPLRCDADPQKVWQRISRSRAAIGTLLLNQSVIAGIGNIYRAELLFLMRIHPTRPGYSIAPEQFAELWRLTVDLLEIGVKYNRIIAIEPGQSKKGLSRLKSAERLNIYKRQQCPRCQKQVRQFELGNRTIYACNQCQQ